MGLIITDAYILNAAVDAKHPRIGWHTWPRELSLGRADVTASSEGANAPKDAPLRPDTWEFWQPSSFPATWTVDLGVGKSVDYVGVFGANIENIKVESSPDNSNWTTFASDTNPANDRPIMFLDTAVSARYWRITVDKLTSADPETKIAVIYIGQVLEVQRGLYGGHSPGPLSRDTTLNQNMSRGGQFLGQYIRKKGVVTDVSLQHLRAGWYRDNFDDFVKSARQYPYFFAWRPQTWSTEVVFGWTDQNIAPSNMGIVDFMEVSFPIRGIGYVD